MLYFVQYCEQFLPVKSGNHTHSYIFEIRKPLEIARQVTSHLIYSARLAQENTRKNLQTQYLNATNDLMNSQRNFKKQKDNYLLAEDVYTVTMDRYREGIASMTEVLQDEMRMSEAQNNYISAHYNYRITNLTLLKLTGQLETLSPSIP